MIAASRPVTGTNGANPRSYADNDGRAQTGNPNGHIIRFKESGGASTASSFTWDIFLFGAEADARSGGLLPVTLRGARRLAQADVVLFDNELSAAQVRNLEKAIKVKVLDRTELVEATIETVEHNLLLGALLVAGSVQAADARFVPVTAAQAQALGIQTQRVGTGSTGRRRGGQAGPTSTC